MYCTGKRFQDRIFAMYLLNFLPGVPKLKCSAMNSMQACEHKAAYITCALIASVMPLHLKVLVCKRRQDV